MISPSKQRDNKTGTYTFETALSAMGDVFTEVTTTNTFYQSIIIETAFFLKRLPFLHKKSKNLIL